MTDRLEIFETRRHPGRKIQGISAVLLPFDGQGRIDEQSFRKHARRTADAGLRLAVNMDTGYIDLLTAGQKRMVLEWTQETLSGKDWFAAGALPLESGQPAGIVYARECAAISERGGVPVIFPSAKLAGLDDAQLIGVFGEVAAAAPRFLAFELGSMFSPHGRMFSDDVLRALMEMPQCLGLKHSSLNRATELHRIVLRDQARPDFVIYTGNDLAADMVEYGSDYLLGLSTFAPELFAARDQAWAESGAHYLELRDMIQYLGWIGFRNPVPAYKHSAAIFLNLTGGLENQQTHPLAPRREAWDIEILKDAAARLQRLLPATAHSTAG
ncbi:MAG TPA: dihydrodipicolinate synthase family protein [Terriglobia bacterium]|nr:dihydrodipicolinate synthase family protein [Terriglobia bacterium]